MSVIQVFWFAMSLVVVVVGLAYLLEIKDPRRRWVLTLVVLLPVVILVLLAIQQG